MKLSIIVVFALCIALAGCTAKAPSADQIMSALETRIKKDNPGATAKLTDIEMVENGRTTKFKFDCLNCKLTASSGSKEVIPSAKGEGSVWLDPQDKKWKFYDASIENEDGSKDFLSFGDHTF